MERICIKNKKNSSCGSVTLLKTDACNSAIVLRCAQFNLMKMNENTGAYEILFRNLVTDRWGLLYVGCLEAGLYKFVETKAPRGYLMPRNNTVTFEITQGSNGSLTNPELQVVNKRCCCRCRH